MPAGSSALAATGASSSLGSEQYLLPVIGSVHSLHHVLPLFFFEVRASLLSPPVAALVA